MTAVPPVQTESMLDYLVVMDSKENTKKCTVAPLSSRPDFRFVLYDRGQPIEALAATLLLHVDGEPLDQLIQRTDAISQKQNKQTLAVIDSHWKSCDKIMRSIAKPLPTLVKIPGVFKTAYPRRSKIFDDPDGGLATIEAIFIAAAFLGVWDETLLDHFHWKQDFLSMNAEVFDRFKLRR